MSSRLSRKVSRKTTSTDAAVEEVSRNEAKTLEEKPDQSTSYQGSVKIAIRKSLEAQQIARCRASF